MDLILCADLHLRHDTPICRLDNYWNAQWEKMNYISKLAIKNKATILIAGDLGHRPQWSNRLLSRFIDFSTNVNIIAIPGQHDMLSRNITDTTFEILTKTAIIKRQAITEVKINKKEVDIFSFGFGEEIVPPQKAKKDIRCIAITHRMVIKNDPLWPGQKAPKARSLLKKYPEYDLILTGDNHETFIQEYKGRLLVNPGSLMRMTIAQEEHRPSIFGYDINENKVTQIFLPIEEEVLNRKHILEKEEMNVWSEEALQAYVKSVQENQDISLSFTNNIKKYINKNKVTNKIRKKIEDALQGQS